MRPYQWTGRARRFAGKQFSIGDGAAIPDLLRNQASRSSRTLDYTQQFFSPGGISSREFVVSAFARQQRPRPSDTRAVERRAVFMFSITVAVVAIPTEAIGKLHRQQLVDDLDRVQNPRIIRRAQTEAH